MSKALRKHLLHALQDLKVKHMGLARILPERDKEIILASLTECQAGAMRIGEQVEAAYGNAVSGVKSLEQYCEQIYLISENMDSYARQKAIYAIGEKLLDEAGNILQRELPDKREVVFLPYKASMWDALESVWMAANRDQDCEAYVMPIPYYDKNADGSFGELHCEKEEYPEYVPVIDYKEYDLKLRLPDMVFIHNPYDGWNHVTSVMPDFYARNLRNFTDRLIYIPYFVMDETRLNNLFYREKMGHFCFLPGVIYSDRVFVQSEAVRRFYIEEFMKAAKKYGLKEARKTITDKIKGLGSPKLERITNISENGEDIPREWIEILYNPDGTRKKLIFYNTSVVSLLRHEKRMLQKIKWVFEVFKEKKDVAFLWRPHPLMESSLKAMRPQLWEAYQEIVEIYQKEAWGIYDATSDIDRAVAISDAYYGDTSSVAELFRVQNKEILFQNVDVLEEGEPDKLWMPYFTDGYVEGKYVYLPAENYNQLFRLDVSVGSLELLGEFDENPAEGYFLMTCMIKKGKKIYFNPVNGKNIPVYDCLEECFCGSYKDEKLLFGDGINFSNCFEYGDHLYFLPGRNKGIVKWNTADGKIEWSTKCMESYRSRFQKEPECWAGSNEPYVYDRKAYAVCEEVSAIIEIDIDDLDVKYYLVEEMEGKIESFCGCDDALYLVSQSGRVAKWDICRKKCVLLTCFEKDFDVRMMISTKNKIVMLSLDEWKGRVYSPDTDKIEDIRESHLFSRLKIDEKMLYRVIDIRRTDKILLVSQNLEFLLYNLITMELENVCQIAEDNWGERVQIISESRENFENGVLACIAEKLLNPKRERNNEKGSKEKRIGQSIYEEMVFCSENKN